MRHEFLELSKAVASFKKEHEIKENSVYDVLIIGNTNSLSAYAELINDGEIIASDKIGACFLDISVINDVEWKRKYETLGLLDYINSGGIVIAKNGIGDERYTKFCKYNYALQDEDIEESDVDFRTLFGI